MAVGMGMPEVVVLVLAFLTPVSAWSQAAGQVLPPLSLAEARRRACLHSWAVLGARSSVIQSEALELQAHAWPNPTASLSVTKLNLTPPAPGGSTSDTTLAVSQLVELGGKRSGRIRGAAAGLAASRAQLEAARVAIDAAVVKGYASARAAIETAAMIRDSANSLARAAEIAQARFDAGEISAAERDEARVAAGRLSADARAAEAARFQSRIALQMLLGEPTLDGNLALADDLDVLSTLALAASGGRNAEREQAALDRRGDVVAARQLAEQARAQLDLQKAQRTPDLSFFAQYESDRPANDNTVGGGIAVPLPLFDRNRGGIAAAEAARDQAEREARRVRAQATAELEVARSALSAAIDRRRLLHDELLPRATSVRETVAFSYQKGLASLLELLEAERSLNEVRLAAVQSASDAVVATVDLLAASGETLP
jgi:cobalt-zinc-cadmium efflux system outer membrane protein